MINGQDFLGLIETRQSERKYLNKVVEKDKIERILQAGRLSPSACNGQPWKFIVVDDKDKLVEVASGVSAKTLKMNTFVDQAPVLIVIIREKSNLSSRAGALVKSKDYSLIDIGIATASMAYQASAEGLGTCIIGWMDEKKVREVLSIPRSKRVELVLSVGYTDNSFRTKVRKPLKEIVSYNKY
jgi:nitroreductase